MDVVKLEQGHLYWRRRQYDHYLNESISYQANHSDYWGSCLVHLVSSNQGRPLKYLHLNSENISNGMFYMRCRLGPELSLG